MENRIKFSSKNGQRNFLDLCIERLNCISLRGLLQFGINTTYSSLKNYYTERRLLPRNLFNDLVYLAKIDIERLDFREVKAGWGQKLGGMRSKRKK